MALTKLPGLSIVITLSFQSILTLGDTFLGPEPNKDAALKITEKRLNNFRVPVEMPYDPNFWPARGRRSRKDPEKPTGSEDCEENFPFDKCQDTAKLPEKSPDGKIPLDIELVPPFDLTDDLLSPGTEKTENNCCEYEGTAAESSALKLPSIPKRFDEIRHKKQKHFPQPHLIFCGNGVYWHPDNLFGEKKKKQDVFWVARGKKNFEFSYP